MRVMRILADTTNRIAEGEVLQLLNIGNPETDETAYLKVIERKTAVLFAAATRLGAVIAELPRDQEEALARYGLDLGFAFQIADDVLDYVSDAGTLGKNVGDDLAEGKPTRPPTHAIARGAPAVRQGREPRSRGPRAAPRGRGRVRALGARGARRASRFGCARCAGRARR